MPNRIIKGSIRESESINSLTWFEEVLFYRLIVSCDDYGRFDARSAIIKGTCFPLKDEVTRKTIEKAISKLVTVGLVELYEVDGKPLLSLPTWNHHQQVRAKTAKYPAPEEATKHVKAENVHLIADDITCNHMISDDCLNPESRIQNPEYNTSCSCTEQAAPVPDAEAEEPANVEPVRLNDGTYWQCSAADYAEYVRLFPGVNIAQEFCKMRAWAEANPRKRKTRGGIKRFVASWLSREQDKGHSAPNVRTINSAPKSGQNRFINFEQNESVDYDAIARKKIAERGMG